MYYSRLSMGLGFFIFLLIVIPLVLIFSVKQLRNCFFDWLGLVEESVSEVVENDEITEDIKLTGDQIEELQSTENYIINKMNEPKPFSSHSTLPTSFK
tara:strand:- start:9226 stop:9519 length:294 start_codon:yes stop_codon:yes gene_type:complete